MSKATRKIFHIKTESTYRRQRSRNKTKQDWKQTDRHTRTHTHTHTHDEKKTNINFDKGTQNIIQFIPQIIYWAFFTFSKQIRTLSQNYRRKENCSSRIVSTASSLDRFSMYLKTNRLLGFKKRE